MLDSTLVPLALKSTCTHAAIAAATAVGRSRGWKDEWHTFGYQSLGSNSSCDSCGQVTWLGGGSCLHQTEHGQKAQQQLIQNSLLQSTADTEQLVKIKSLLQSTVCYNKQLIQNRLLKPKACYNQQLVTIIGKVCRDHWQDPEMSLLTG